MTGERECRIFLDRRGVNFLTSLMPTMEGLFLATVLDGKRGEVRLSYHMSMEDEIRGLLDSLACRAGNGAAHAPAPPVAALDGPSLSSMELPS